MLINENNTTKKCFKCDNDLNVVKNIKMKKIKVIKFNKLTIRKFNKWSLSDLRNVRYCKNTRCIKEDYKNFYIGRHDLLVQLAEQRCKCIK